MHVRTTIPHTLLTLASLLLATAVLQPGAALAQQQDETTEGHDAAQKSQHTPSTTFKNDSGEIILQTNADGGLWVPGKFGTGAIPAEGAGTRLMWYPAKAAFRVGHIDPGSETEDYWNDPNVGNYSVALGWNTQASGTGSVALGHRAFADEVDAVAMSSGVATGPAAVALGNGAAATATDAFATGFDTEALGEAATAMGHETDAVSKFTVTMGDNTTAVGEAATAMGQDTDADGKAAMAMGNQTLASGKNAIAMGDSTEASARDAVAMGDSTNAKAPHATAMGSGTTASGEKSTAMGWLTTASGIVATTMGFATTASGQNSVAAGVHTDAATRRSLSIGECNSSNTSADGTLLVAGNGSAGLFGCNSESDAFRVDADGEAFADAHKTFSDRRLKTGIEPLGESTLEKLADLRPVRFHFKNETTHPSGEQIGLIAQDVREEFPALVSKDSNGYLSLAYPKLTAVLLKGIQEQQRRIDSLQNRVQQIEALQKRVARLEAGSSGGSVLAGLPGSDLLLGLLIGGLLGAGLLWRRLRTRLRIPSGSCHA